MALHGRIVKWTPDNCIVSRVNSSNLQARAMLEKSSMRMRFAPLAFALVLLAPMTAIADDAPDPTADPEVSRILKDSQHTVRWNYVPSGKSDRYGHAETLTEATPDKTKEVMTDFGHMKDLHKKFSSARVVAKENDATDVYMKLPVKVGPVQIDQYQVLRFGPAKQVGSAWVVEGKGVSGNMKNGHVILTVRPVDAKHSLIKVDILLTPSVPAPQSVVDEELRDAAQDLANGLKDKAQGWVGPVTSL
jgi:hypothetical protein